MKLKTRIKIINRFEDGVLIKTNHIPQVRKGWKWFNWWEEIHDNAIRIFNRDKLTYYSEEYAQKVIDSYRIEKLQSQKVKTFTEDFVDYPEEE